jgi:tetratricopeptide (TPR) repeat protein
MADEKEDAMSRNLALIALAAVVVVGCPGCIRPAPKVSAVDHYVKGQMLLDGGDVEAALAELAQAVKGDPNLSIAHATLGDIHRRRGNWDLAQRSYEAACDANPFAFMPHYNLGVTYQVLAQAAKAVEEVEKFLKRAVEVYLRAITLQPDDFDSNLNISACYFQLGEAEQADKYCRQAIAIDPNSAKAYGNLATIQESQGDLYEAIKAYKACLELDMHQPEVLMNLGSAYMRQGRLKAAMKTFQQAAQEDPNGSAPWEKIGACYFYMRDFAEAQKAYQKALQMDSNSPMAHRGMGVVYMAQFVLDNKATDLRDKALEEWNVSLEIQPDQEDLKQLVQKYTPVLEEPKL